MHIPWYKVSLTQSTIRSLSLTLHMCLFTSRVVTERQILLVAGIIRADKGRTTRTLSLNHLNYQSSIRAISSLLTKWGDYDKWPTLTKRRQTVTFNSIDRSELISGPLSHRNHFVSSNSLAVVDYHGLLMMTYFPKNYHNLRVIDTLDSLYL